MRLVTPDIGTLFWMLLMFIMVLWILKKFAWKPILNALKDREISIEDALKSAERARKEMEALQVDNEKIMVKARQERDQIIKESRKSGEQIVNDAKEQAGIEAAIIIEKTLNQLEIEKQAAVDDFRRQVAGLSVDIAEKILKEKLKDSKEQKELIDKLLKDVKMN